jgi:hypothetical protein
MADEPIHLLPAMPGYGAVVIWFCEEPEEEGGEPCRERMTATRVPLVGWRYYPEHGAGKLHEPAWLEPLVQHQMGGDETLVISQPDGSLFWDGIVYDTVEAAMNDVWHGRIYRWRTREAAIKKAEAEANRPA